MNASVGSSARDESASKRLLERRGSVHVGVDVVEAEDGNELLSEYGCWWGLGACWHAPTPTYIRVLERRVCVHVGVDVVEAEDRDELDR